MAGGCITRALPGEIFKYHTTLTLKLLNIVHKSEKQCNSRELAVANIIPFLYSTKFMHALCIVVIYISQGQQV